MDDSLRAVEFRDAILKTYFLNIFKAGYDLLYFDEKSVSLLWGFLDDLKKKYSNNLEEDLWQSSIETEIISLVHLADSLIKYERVDLAKGLVFKKTLLIFSIKFVEYKNQISKELLRVKNEKLYAKKKADLQKQNNGKKVIPKEMLVGLNEVQKQILEFISKEDLTREEIVKKIDSSVRTIQRHLTTLQDANLIAKEWKDNAHYYKLV